MNEKEFARDLIDAGYHPHGSKEEKDILDRHELEHDSDISNINNRSTSGGKDRVYKHKQHKKAYIVYAGTQDSKDAATDFALAAGKEDLTPRFKNAKKLGKQTKMKYGDENVTAIGHSLGGALAEKSGVSNVITYNRGIGLNGLGKTVQRGTHYRTGKDPISILSKTQKYKSSSKNIILPSSKKKGVAGLFASHKTKYLQ